MQRVYFDGQMLPVATVAELMRESGKSTDAIFSRIGWLLGFITFEDAASVLDAPAGSSRYPCTFDCTIERYTPTK